MRLHLLELGLFTQFAAFTPPKGLTQFYGAHLITMSLADYTRLQKLSSGAFGTTSLVQHKRSGEKVVLKRVPCRNMKAANLALQEVKVLLSCHHEGVVGYHDFFLDTDADENIVICLLMEFCDGGDLWERIALVRREQTVLQAPTAAASTAAPAR